MPTDVTEGFDPQTYAIIGAAQHVHTVLGQGYLEYVYQCALARTLRNRGIPFEREVELPVVFEGEPLECTYRCDFLLLRHGPCRIEGLDDVLGYRGGAGHQLPEGRTS